MRNNTDIVFKALCQSFLNLSEESLPTSDDLSDLTGLSRYAVLKCLHELQEKGLAQKACKGRPKEIIKCQDDSTGEFFDYIVNAGPPIHGWSLTEAGIETETYKMSAAEHKDHLDEMEYERILQDEYNEKFTY